MSQETPSSADVNAQDDSTVVTSPAQADLEAGTANSTENQAPPVSAAKATEPTDKQLPTTAEVSDETWPNHWKAQGMPWRTEPEIPADRQRYLTERRQVAANIQEAIYPFKGITLTRADVEWLLATHEDEGKTGLLLWDKPQSKSNSAHRHGLDLRGADVRSAKLEELPLVGLWGGLPMSAWLEATPEQREQAAIHLEHASLKRAHLEGSCLSSAYLDNADIGDAYLIACDLVGASMVYCRALRAHLERSNFTDAQMERISASNANFAQTHLCQANLLHANLEGANLESADLSGAHLESANLRRAQAKRTDFREAQLPRANLSEAHLEKADLSSALLEHAHLDQAHLEQCDLTFANLEGADLRKAYLRQAQLYSARLVNVNLVEAYLERTTLVNVNLTGAKLTGAHLTAATLNSAQLHGATLTGANLRQTKLREAQLIRADLREAHLEEADLSGANLAEATLARAWLTGANCTEAQFRDANLQEARLERANLTGALLEGADLRLTFFDSATILKGTTLSHATRGPARLADVRWGGVNLAILEWSSQFVLGDERSAWTWQPAVPAQAAGANVSRKVSRKTPRTVTRAERAAERAKARDEHYATQQKHMTERIALFREAVRANRQVATVLRDQGMNEEGDRFAFHAQRLQREVFRQQGQRGRWFGSWLMDAVAGYGYRPRRAFIAYILIVLAFAALYLLNAQFAAPHLSWDEALVLSVSSFHGRGFFTSDIHLGDTLARLAAGDAIIGLLIDVTFIATFTQRFFGK